MKKYIENHIVLFNIIAFIIAMPLVWGITYQLLDGLSDNWHGTIKYSLTAVITLIIMYAVWSKSIFTLRCPGFFKGLISFGLLGLIGALGALVFSYDTVDTTPTVAAVIACVLCNLAIAVSEEFLFRGLILHSALKVFTGKSNRILLAILLSCGIFGVRHLINLVTMPDAVFGTLAQVVFTFMAGTYLCAVYLRTNNIWICVLIHFFEDFSTSVWTLFSTSAAASVSQDTSVGAAFGMIAMQIPYVIFAILMIRDKKWKYQD